eukprot:GABW01002085.1.p2 GENE.GABW01002085.1~~GABW01002085.1.p2  ORF type:complete len:103 (-),score=22.21 GABW01002085.1:3-311(-)
MIWLGISRLWPNGLVWFTLCLGIGLCVLASLIFVVSGAPGGAIPFLILAAINAFLVWWVRNRIPFAAALLKIACELTQKYPATILVAVVSQFVLVFYFVHST